MMQRNGAIGLAPALLLALMTTPLNAAVLISEIMYHPPSDLDADEFVELRNTDAAPIALDGWCLNGVSFCFPAGATIPANGFVVLARDATRFQATYGFAPNFVYAGTLSNGGETLTLVNGASVVQDQVTYSDRGDWPCRADGDGPSLEVIDPAQDNGTPRNWRACTAGPGHTAGAVNSVNAVGLPPWISNVVYPASFAAAADLPVTAGVVAADAVSLTYRADLSADVTLTMFDDGNHGDGAAGDGVYGASIPGQSAGAIVRFQISATGPTGAMRFPRTDDTINYVGRMIPTGAVTSSLPIFHWLMTPEDYQAIVDGRFWDVTRAAVLAYDGAVYDNVMVRQRGQGSIWWPKLHWRFKFPQNHDFVETDFFPLAVDELVLQGAYGDKSYSREMLAYETYRDAGHPYCMMQQVAVYQNLQFYGLYVCMEAMEGEYLVRNGLDEEGAWYKAYDDARSRTLGQLPTYYEKQTRIDEDYSDLFALLDGVNNLGGAARTAFLLGNVNVPGMVNYLAATTIMHDNDHVAKNYFLYRDTRGTQRWTFHPHDKDLTWGRNYDGGAILSDVIWADNDQVYQLVDVSPSHPLFGDSEHQKVDYKYNRIIDALFEIPEIREMYLRRLRTLMDALLPVGRYEARLDALAPLIAVDAEADRLKWGQYGQAQTSAAAIDILKNDYLPRRRTHLFSTHRTANMIPPAQSAQPPIVINEIHYNPLATQEIEFVELFNPSPAESVDLSGWSVSGIDATLPPGSVILPQGYVVLVRNDVQFRATYGNAYFIPVQYRGRLDDGGENLVLRDRSYSIIDTVRYDDDAPWTTTPDGGGPSLELIDAAQDNDRPANWAASTIPGGTPGAPNSVAAAGAAVPPLWVNELLPVNTTGIQDEQNEREPWIEIFNASTSPVDIGGMHLTDNYALPAKWTFPAGTIIGGRQWLLVWADNEPAEGPLHSNFRLQSTGGSVGLYTAGGTIIDYLNYDPLPANVSFGKFPDGQPVRNEFVTPTPSAANVVPPAPLILNEYNAVRDDSFLAGGGSDVFWDRVLGNGGDWIELVVTQDHLDVRGWQLVISDDTGTPQQVVETLTLTNHALWSDLRSGTIVTISENLPDDVSFDPTGGDWWINVRAANVGTGTYVTASNFPVSHRNWQLTIRNAQAAVVFGPAGEGIRPSTGIGSDEVCELDEGPGPLISARSQYVDSSRSTFGAPNELGDGSTLQDFSALRNFVCTPTSSAGPDQSVCENSPATLSGQTVNAAGSFWTTAGDGQFGNPFLLNTVYTPGAADLAAGSVVLTLRADPNAPCSAPVTDTLTITFARNPTADAGPDATRCRSLPLALAGGGANIGSVQWSSSGDGMFDNPAVLSPVYTPGAGDVASGSATLTLTIHAASPCATPAVDALVANWIAVPVAGDVSGDGQRNGDDIAAFVAILLNPTGPTPAYCAADANADGLVNAADVPIFAELLLSP